MSETKKITKIIDHPLEDFFEIESGTTEIEVHKREGELITSEGYDAKDREIDAQFEEIYDSAMEGYDTLSDELLKVEGKYKARLGEVSVQHLNAALNAANSKAKLKDAKDKLEVKKKAGPSSVTTNNTLIVNDRNKLLDQLRKGMESNEEFFD